MLRFRKYYRETYSKPISLGNGALSEETSRTFFYLLYQSVVHRRYIFALAMFDAHFLENDALSEKKCIYY